MPLLMGQNKVLLWQHRNFRRMISAGARSRVHCTFGELAGTLQAEDVQARLKTAVDGNGKLAAGADVRLWSAGIGGHHVTFYNRLGN